MSEPDSSMSIGMTRESRKLLDAVVKRTGMQKRIVVERLLDWLVKQPVSRQALILGQLEEAPMPEGETLDDLADLVARRLGIDYKPPKRRKGQQDGHRKVS